MKPAATIAAFRLHAKSAALRNSGKSSSGLSGLAVLCGGPSP